MKLVSKCPKAVIDSAISSTYIRANWELEKLEDFTKDMDIASCRCVFTDKGLVGNDYISEFIISPAKVGFRSLNEVLEWLRGMATPPDLSNC